MSVDDYLDSIAICEHAQFALNNVIIFVDFHEDYARNSTTFWDAILEEEVKDAPRHIIKAHLETGDVLIIRVCPKESSTAAALAAIDENVTIGGGTLTPSQLLADPDTTSLCAVIIYERKTISDLVTSLWSMSDVPVEGHMQKQLAEMLSFAEMTGARPCFLLEGYMAHALSKKPIGAMNEDKLHSFLTNTYLSRGITIWHSAHVADSARHVLKVARFIVDKKIDSGSWIRLSGNTNEPRIRVRKERNADVTRYFISTLQAMPLMSEERAKAIVAVYPTIPLLVAGMGALPTEKARIDAIANLTVNNRRLGDVLAANVVARYTPVPVQKPKIILRPTTMSSSSSVAEPSTPPAAAEPTVAPNAPARRVLPFRQSRPTIPLVEEDGSSSSDSDFEEEDLSSSSSDDGEDEEDEEARAPPPKAKRTKSDK